MSVFTDDRNNRRGNRRENADPGTVLLLLRRREKNCAGVRGGGNSSGMRRKHRKLRPEQQIGTSHLFLDRHDIFQSKIKIASRSRYHPSGAFLKLLVCVCWPSGSISSPMMDAETLKKRFGRRVRSIRAARGLTQEGLAEKAGLSPEYVSQIERGEASPSFETVSSIASAFSVGPSALFDFSDLEG